MNANDIKWLRNELGLTQADFAHKLGVTVTSVNRWENGATKPSKLALEKIVKLKENHENQSSGSG
jgi:DNA-binding transcriptional regulator YiaG